MAFEEKREKSRKIYTTKVIEQLKKDCGEGYDIDWEPFYNKDLELRDSGITFRLTDDEVEEYQKCYDDPEYYIAKYCKFQTDDGWSTVELRDFQKNVVDTVTAEIYDPKTDKVYPKNRNVIWMASRQSGKCNLLKINELDETTNHPNEIKIEDIYYRMDEKKSIISKFLHLLRKIYMDL